MAIDFSNTKFSDIDLAFVKHYLRIEPEIVEDDNELQFFMVISQNFVTEHTRMTAQEIDDSASAFANIIFLKMVSDLYDNRSATTSSQSIDPIFGLMLKNLGNPVL